MARESVQLSGIKARLDLTWHLKRTEELLLVFIELTVWSGVGALTVSRTTQHVTQTMQSTLSGPSCSMAQLTTRVRAAATRGICSCEMQVALTGIINEQGEGSQYWPLWMWQNGSCSEL